MKRATFWVCLVGLVPMMAVISQLAQSHFATAFNDIVTATSVAAASSDEQASPVVQDELESDSTGSENAAPEVDQPQPGEAAENPISEVGFPGLDPFGDHSLADSGAVADGQMASESPAAPTGGTVGDVEDPGQSAEPEDSQDSSWAAAGSATLAELQQAYEQAEQSARSLSEQLQTASRRYVRQHPKIVGLRTQLLDAVTRAFDTRRRIQSARMGDLQSKLDQIRTSLQLREQRRERIIERRVEELLDPSIDWKATTEQARTDQGVLDAATPLELPVLSQSSGTPQESGGVVVPAVDEPQPTAPRRTPNDTTYEAPLKQATNLTPKEFRWDKMEELLTQLRSHSEFLASHRPFFDQTTNMLKQLNTPWKDVGSDDRLEVARLLIPSHFQRYQPDPSARGSMPAPLNAKRISEDEELYDKMRLGLLRTQWDKMNKSLDAAEDQLNLLTRRWAQYQGEIADLELSIREAQLVFDAAEEIHRITAQSHLAGTADTVTVLQAKLEADRARIALNRARTHLSRIQSVGEANPQFDPSQYQPKLKVLRELLNQVQEANPDLIPIPEPLGPGGGFF